MLTLLFSYKEAIIALTGREKSLERTIKQQEEEIKDLSEMKM
jgi:hypothetical protein